MAPFLAWWTSTTATAWRRCRSRRKASSGGDLTAGIFIDAMKPDKRIEDEQTRLQPGDGLIEGSAVGLEVETQAGRGDHLDVEFGEADAGGGTNAFESAADDVECVLGGIEQDAAWSCHGEAAQAGDTGGDGNGEIEGEEGFAALGLAADDPDGFVRPQPIDQPALLLGTIVEAPGWLDWKLGHRRRRIVALVSFAAGTAQVWKNSVSSIWRASCWAAASSRSAAMIIRARRLPWA